MDEQDFDLILRQVSDGYPIVHNPRGFIVVYKT